MSPQLAGWPAQKRLCPAQPNPTRSSPTLVADTQHLADPTPLWQRRLWTLGVPRPPSGSGPVFSTPHSRDPRVLAQRPHR